MNKDAPAGKISLPKKQPKSTHNKTVSKKRQIFDLESEGEVLSLQLETEEVTTRPHKGDKSSGNNKRKKTPFTKTCKRRKAKKNLMAKTSESLFATSLCQNAIPVEATWTNLSSVTL